MPDIIEGEVVPAAAPTDLSSVIDAAIEQHTVSPDTSPPAPLEPGSGGAEPRSRDDKGRFAAKEVAGPDAETPSAEVSAPPVDAPAAGQLPISGAPPPNGFSPESKANWDKVPQYIKDDIAKREAEMDRGLSRYGGLGQFAEIAERNGTTIGNAVAAYNQLENTFMRDPIAGVEQVCQYLNIDPRVLTSAMQVRYGGLLEHQASNNEPGPQAPGNGHSMPAFNPEALINTALDRFRSEQEMREVNSQIQAFRADPANKFFDNVYQEMLAIAQSGRAQTIRDAYDAAVWLNPETRAIMLQQRTASTPTAQTPAAIASQARAAAKAVSGSPRPGLTPGAVAPNASLTETIDAAIALHSGSI